MNKESIKIDGMSCVNCAAGIEKKLSRKGIINAKVNFSTSEVIYDKNEIDQETIKRYITELGYEIIDTKKKK